MLEEKLQLVSLAVQFFCVIFSLRSFRLNWPLAYKFFAGCIFIGFLTDMLGTLWLFYLHRYKEWSPFCVANNSWITTFGVLPAYLCAIWAYYEILKGRNLKKTILVFAIIFTLFAIYNFTFGQGICAVNSHTFIAFSLLILLLVFAYFEQLRKDAKIVILKKQPMVWISVGLFLWSLLTIPFMFTMNYLNVNNPSLATSFFILYLIVNIICYLFYIKAFLCPPPTQK